MFWFTLSHPSAKILRVFLFSSIYAPPFSQTIYVRTVSTFVLAICILKTCLRCNLRMMSRKKSQIKKDGIRTTEIHAHSIQGILVKRTVYITIHSFVIFMNNNEWTKYKLKVKPRFNIYSLIILLLKQEKTCWSLLLLLMYLNDFRASCLVTELFIISDNISQIKKLLPPFT